jgi:hypothetical protein
MRLSAIESKAMTELMHIASDDDPVCQFEETDERDHFAQKRSGRLMRSKVEALY